MAASSFYLYLHLSGFLVVKLPTLYHHSLHIVRQSLHFVQKKACFVFLNVITLFYFPFHWAGFIRCAESIPVLFGVPLTAFLNESSQNGYGRAGYFVCSASTAISAILMFFVGYPAGGRQNVSKYSANGSITSHYTVPTTDCPDILNRSFSSRYNNWYSSGTQTQCTSW